MPILYGGEVTQTSKLSGSSRANAARQSSAMMLWRPTRMTRPGAGAIASTPSAIRKPELDAPVARESIRRLARIERLSIREGCRREVIGRHTIEDQQLHHGNRSRGRKLPVVLIRPAGNRLAIRMAIDTQHPRQIRRNLFCDATNGGGDLVDLRLAAARHVRAIDREQHVALEHEAIADDADIRLV